MLFYQTLLVATTVLAKNTSYIVRLKSEHQKDLVKRGVLNLDWVLVITSKHDGNSLVESEPSKITFQYNLNDFLGFAVKTSPEAMKELSQDARVDYWVYDNPVKMYAPTPRVNPESSVGSWGIDRINQRALPLDGKYSSVRNQGEGVTVFVIDSGIDSTHPEFEGRAKVGPSFLNGEFKELDTPVSDGHGHGTHCAGTIAGKTFGVAPKANIVSLKVFDSEGSGGDSGVIAALHYAIDHAVPGKTVISMSLGTDLENCVENPLPHKEGCNNPIMKEAVRLAVMNNIPVSAAAGNDNVDACKAAPASELLAYTVASTNDFDKKSSFSNYGPCVDIFGPGSAITSAVPNGGVDTWDGTSMAAPHVSGVFAILLSSKSYEKTQDIYDEVTNLSTKDIIKGVPDKTVNRLLYIE